MKRARRCENTWRTLTSNPAKRITWLLEFYLPGKPTLCLFPEITMSTRTKTTKKTSGPTSSGNTGSNTLEKAIDQLRVISTSAPAAMFESLLFLINAAAEAYPPKTKARKRGGA